MTEPNGDRPPLRIVVAEDDAIIRMDLCQILQEEGYEVVGDCGQGDLAIDLIREHRPDDAVLDVKMPGLDGISAAGAVAAERLCAVVLLTAFSQRKLIESARAAGDANAPKSHTKGGDNAWMFSDEMRFHFVNSKTLNAFTTGGNHMYIYTALFQQCESEDELAAVVAHEYAHVYCRHVQQGMNRQYAILGAAAGAGVAGAAIGYKQDKTEGALTYGCHLYT